MTVLGIMADGAVSDYNMTQRIRQQTQWQTVGAMMVFILSPRPPSWSMQGSVQSCAKHTKQCHHVKAFRELVTRIQPLKLTCSPFNI